MIHILNASSSSLLLLIGIDRLCTEDWLWLSSSLSIWPIRNNAIGLSHTPWKCIKVHEMLWASAFKCNCIMQQSGRVEPTIFLPCVTWVTRLHNWRYLASLIPLTWGIASLFAFTSCFLTACSHLLIVFKSTGLPLDALDLENGQKMRSTLQFTWIFERASTSLG